MAAAPSYSALVRIAVLMLALAALPACDDKKKSDAPPNKLQMVEAMTKALCTTELAKDFDPLLVFEIETMDISAADKSAAYAEMDRMWDPIAKKHEDSLALFKGHVTQEILDPLTFETQQMVFSRCKSRVKGATKWSDEEVLLAIQILFQRSGQ